MFAQALAALLWPARCAACTAFVSEGRCFCPDCEAAVVPLALSCPGCAMPTGDGGHRCRGCLRRPFPFARARAALAYGGPLVQALLRFKHGNHRYLARPLAQYLSPVVGGVWLASDLVCPVPLHPRRLRRRGFNQALELARGAARDLPNRERRKLTCDLLLRTADTPALGHGSPAARARAVAGAFALGRPSLVAGRHVLVIDDVMTSGATLAECARTLLDAGAGEVSVAALARAV